MLVNGVRLLITHFRTREFLDADDDFQQRLIEQVAVAMDDHVPAARETVRQLEEIALLPPLAFLPKPQVPTTAASIMSASR